MSHIVYGGDFCPIPLNYCSSGIYYEINYKMFKTEIYNLGI